MPLTKDEKDLIINKVVEILKSPDKDKLIEDLKTRVFNTPSSDNDQEEETTEEVIYAVIQAIDELYG